jgi:hypothetical protein
MGTQVMMGEVVRVWKRTTNAVFAWYLAQSAEGYAAWKQARQPTAECIESTAWQFIGRPYLWGGNSPKGLDCSGFTKTVCFLNGLALQRDSSKQAGQGAPVPLDADLSQLKKGDLLFFGRRPRDGEPDVVFLSAFISETSSSSIPPNGCTSAVSIPNHPSATKAASEPCYGPAASFPATEL